MPQNEHSADSAPTTSRRMLLLGAAGYVVFMSVLLGLLFSARHQVLQGTDAETATRQWQKWVDDVERQTETTGPVERTRPETAEPPALILMRDLFGVCLTATLLFGTILYGSFWWLLRGALVAGDSPNTDDGTPNKNSRTEKPL